MTSVRSLLGASVCASQTEVWRCALTRKRWSRVTCEGFAPVVPRMWGRARSAVVLGVRRSVSTADDEQVVVVELEDGALTELSAKFHGGCPGGPTTRKLPRTTYRQRIGPAPPCASLWARSACGSVGATVTGLGLVGSQRDGR